MISVLLIFGILFFTSYFTGKGAVVLLRRFIGAKKDPSHDALFFCMTGLMIAGVFAEWISLFHGVGAGAFLLFLISAVLSALLLKRAGEEEFFTDGMKKLPSRHMILAAGLVLFYAYGTARGYIHTDTTLYHAQSIHWIESFGSVKGLALLHNRIGYNSAAFALTALYSFSWLTGQSFHVVAGFLALLLMLECLKVLRVLRKADDMTTADYVRVAGIYYLLTIYDEMVSPASDYFMVCIAFYLIIRALETKEENVFSFGLLTLLSAFCVTVKLSAAPLMLILILPVVRLFKARELPPVKTFFTFAGCAVCIFLPFLIRNVLLTGYLLYPYPAIDLFDVPWKLDPGYALRDQREIMVWGRGYTDVYQYGAPLSYWVKDWFLSGSMIDRAAILTAFAGAVLFAVVFALSFLSKKEEGNGKNRAENRFTKKEAALSVIVAAGLIFWFRAAPLMRYGCFYVYTMAALTGALLYKKLFGNKNTVFRVALLLFLIGKGVLFTGECVRTFPADGNEFLLVQKDYVSPPCVAYEIDDETFYHAEGAGTGYTPFPSSPFPADIRLAGDALPDGFLPDKPVSE